MKLSGAFLCLDCDELTTEVDACPACASKFLWPISSWVTPVDWSANELATFPSNNNGGARQGGAGQGGARHGGAGQGKAGSGWAWRGKAWQGMAGLGAAKRG